MSSPTKTILLTGANGFIGAHVINIALEKGYNVRATARSESSISSLRATFPDAAKSSRLTFAIVPHITKHESYKDALVGVTAIVHTASPLRPEPQEQRDGPPTARDRWFRRRSRGCQALWARCQGYRPGYTYSEKDWNPMSYERPRTAPRRTARQKGLAEHAMWDWMNENKSVGFTLSNICPPWVFGPYVGKPDLNRMSESMGKLWNLVDADGIPPTDFAGFADVRDVAKALLLAIERPKAAGERFLVGNHFDYQTAADLIREEVPEAKARVPEGQPGAGKTAAVYAVDGSKVEKILGLKYTLLNATLRDSIRQMLEVERTSKSG